MIDQLIEQIQSKENPTVVGLDPRWNFIPSFIKDEMLETYGNTPKACAEAFYKFNIAIIDAVYDLVPAVKPQVAMYERLGVEGIDAYIKTIAYAKEKGLVIIGDIKRSDIASTAKDYAEGHIGLVDVEGTSHEIYKEDFITLNPFLGIDSVEPYFEACQKRNKGLFLLVKTSNPNSGQIQDLKVGNQFLYEYIGNLVSEWGQTMIGQFGFSKIGAVVGATHKEQADRLREQMPHTFFLVPGYGAQGGKAEDLAGCFNKDGLGAIVNSSRGIIAAYTKDEYKRQFDEKEFAQASRQAVLAMKKDLNRVL